MSDVPSDIDPWIRIRDPVGSYHGRMMSQTDSVACRLGAVSYLNTLPLIDGLDRIPGVSVVPDVPARLADRLVAGETDLSLCSVIDQQVSGRPLEVEEHIIVSHWVREGLEVIGNRERLARLYDGFVDIITEQLDLVLNHRHGLFQL